MFKTPPPASSWSRCGSLWQCPGCGKLYPRAGQGHSCCVVSLEDHFRSRPRARQLFDAFRGAVEEVGGPVRLSIAKTRIGLITRLTFSAVMPRKDYLRAHILLRRRVPSQRFIRIDDGPPYWVHHFEVRDEADLDDELRTWLREAYRVGTGR
ncbi:MAG: DUF5655 domain-containing protein [Acidobacteriota bacterium]